MLVMVVQMANEAGVHDVSEGEDAEVEYNEWRDITWERRWDVNRWEGWVMEVGG